MLRSRLTLRAPKRRTKSSVVIELLKGNEVPLRVQIPVQIEEDDDGLYVVAAAHNGDFEKMEIDGIRVTQRHRTHFFPRRAL